MANPREKSPGRWELRVTAGKDKRTGKPRRLSRTFHGSKRDALRAQSKFEAEVFEGQAIGTKATFEQLLERWHESVKAHQSPSTSTRARYAIDGHLVPALGKEKAVNLTAEDFDQLTGAMLDKGAAKSSVNKVLYVASAAYEKAIRWQWLSYNPVKDAEKPRLGKQSLELPDLGQVHWLLEEVSKRNEVMGRLFWLTLATGMRRGEVIGLQRRDVDLASGVIHVRRQIVESKKQLIEKPPKWDSARSFAMGDYAEAVIRVQMEMMEERAKEFGLRVKPSAYVWSDEANGSIPWRPSRLTRYLGRITKEEGIELSPHTLRHLNATHLANHQTYAVSLDSIARRLGHAKVTTTARYVHRVAESDRLAAQALNSFLTHSADGSD